MIPRICTRLVLVLSLALPACAGASASQPPAATASAAATALDGASYEVTLLFPGEAPVADTLRFADGKFESTACTPLGFPRWSEYTASPGGDATSFEVVALHPTGTRMEWKGTIRGGVVEGTVTRTMNGQRAVASFRGTRRG